ncbi:MAG: PIN domain-containing protein [Thermoanaerobaculia bacterium]
MTVLLDTNFLLSAITDRSSQQRQVTEILFRAAAQRRATIAVPQFILFEATFVLTSFYHRGEEAVSSLIGDLTRLAGVEVVQGPPVDAWLELWPARVPGAVDAALAALSVQYLWPVATFDQRFALRLKLVGGEVWQPE